ncbi:MAG: 23S rRNA (guanosine(2251)-2'-O)-methyltransferase RlmB [Proteobacteria bacterium]|nr:23S rRNA (guanosine(2251)-2'-O)-methyltransferase RlmB [Pseudomonadota bacterium]
MQKRIESNILLTDDDLSPQSQHCQKSFAYFMVGISSLLEYLQSPYGQVSHIILPSEYPLSPEIEKKIYHYQSTQRSKKQTSHKQVIITKARTLEALVLSEPWHILKRKKAKPSDDRFLHRPLKECVFRVVISLWQEKIFTDTVKDADTLVVILDHIHDPRNFGAIIRSAAFFGVRYLFIPKDRQVPLTETVVHCSRGGVGYVQVIQVVNLSRIIKRLKSLGYWILGADICANAENISDLTGFYDRVALILGHEGSGLSTAVKKKCDRKVTIPGNNSSISSLNVSVAAGILLQALSMK